MGQGIICFPVQLTTGRIENLTPLIYTLLHVMTKHTLLFFGSSRGIAGGWRVTDCSNDFQSPILQERPRSTRLTLQHVDMPTATTCRCSQKEYGPGYMVIMKTWPNLADTPPCPRKVVEESTLHQHRLSCKAAEGRMMGILMSCEQGGIFLFVRPLPSCND